MRNTISKGITKFLLSTLLFVLIAGCSGINETGPDENTGDDKFAKLRMQFTVDGKTAPGNLIVSNRKTSYERSKISFRVTVRTEAFDTEESLIRIPFQGQTVAVIRTDGYDSIFHLKI